MRARKVSVSQVLEQRKNELIKLLPNWNNAQSSGIFAINFFDDYFIDSLKKDAATVFASAGKISGVKPFVAENNLRGYFIMEGQNANVKVYFTLTPETPALIQAFDISGIPK